MTIALLACGALVREVLDIVARREWDADVLGVPALLHMRPEFIAPAVEQRFLKLRESYERVIVVYGDCGTMGALDKTLAEYGIERTDGPHCYEMYGGEEFTELMREEPGTYFLTDFLVRGFNGLVVKGMGLDEFPQLKSVYFANYKRLMYFVQKRDPELIKKAQAIAEYLELPLEIRETGYGLLEERLVELVEG